MPNLNLTIMMGHLTAEPELRYLPGGQAVAEFSVASHRKIKDNEEVIFLPCTVWGKIAENCARYLTKGSAVLVRGHLRQENWKTKDGQKRTTIKLVAEDVQFVGQHEKTDSPRQSTPPPYTDNQPPPRTYNKYPASDNPIPPPRTYNKYPASDNPIPPPPENPELNDDIPFLR